MKWLRPAILKLNNTRAFPSIYRGYADTRLLARNIPNPSSKTVFPGDLIVCENPWDEGKLLVRRVKTIYSNDSDQSASAVWVVSETINGGIDSKVFGPLPMSSILGRAIYYYNNDNTHGPVENNTQSLRFDREYISNGHHFFFIYCNYFELGLSIVLSQQIMLQLGSSLSIRDRWRTGLKNLGGVLVFAPLGFLLRLLFLYLFQSESIFGQPFELYLVNIVASFILGFINNMKSSNSTEWLMKGVSVGFCGCASTFGSLVSLSAYGFVEGIRKGSFHNAIISWFIILVGTESCRASFESGKDCYLFITSRKSIPQLPVQSTMNESSRSVSEIVELIILIIEFLGYISLIPLYQYTAAYLFGFVFTIIGAVLRYYGSILLNPVIKHFFLGTFVCNLLGSIVSAIIRVVMMRGSFSFVLSSFLQSLSNGLASSLTTMSTYAMESSNLRSSHYGWFTIYSNVSTLISFGLCCLVYSLSV